MLTFCRILPPLNDLFSYPPPLTHRPADVAAAVRRCMATIPGLEPYWDYKVALGAPALNLHARTVVLDELC